jgi:hypothetical protein
MRENPFFFSALCPFFGVSAVPAQHLQSKAGATGFPNCGTVWHEYGR